MPPTRRVAPAILAVVVLAVAVSGARAGTVPGTADPSPPGFRHCLERAWCSVSRAGEAAWDGVEACASGVTGWAHRQVADARARLPGLRRAARDGFRAVADAALTAPQPTIGLRLLAHPAPGAPPGLRWLALPGPAPTLPARVVVLVHGLDDQGGLWDELAPVLDAEGYTVVRFDYPNDQAITPSADLLESGLRQLRALGVRSADLVCHSMGGLVARDVLSRPDGYASQARGHEALPDVERLVMLGTPHTGAPLAWLQPLSEAREQVTRWMASGRIDPRIMLGYLTDGDGAAAADLTPGSPFLVDLNARPMPAGVAMTCVVATLADEELPELGALLGTRAARRVLGPERSARVMAGVRQAITAVGDGIVGVPEAELDGCPDLVRITANHRWMIRRPSIEHTMRDTLGWARVTAPAIPVILERLRRPAAGF